MNRDCLSSMGSEMLGWSSAVPVVEAWRAFLSLDGAGEVERWRFVDMLVRQTHFSEDRVA